MSTSDFLRARANALRTEARFHTGAVRARFIARAESIERDLDGAARLGVEPITTLRLRAGQPVLGEV